MSVAVAVAVTMTVAVAVIDTPVDDVIDGSFQNERICAHRNCKGRSSADSRTKNRGRVFRHENAASAAGFAPVANYLSAGLADEKVQFGFPTSVSLI